MKVYKYCRPEHNPLNGCRTLMLNSNIYFRNNYKGEGDLINDIYEGRCTGVDRKNNKFTNLRTPDGYMFCTSTKKVTDEYASANFDDGYNSCYCIKDVDAFNKKILEIASRSITFDLLHPNAISFIEGFMSTHNVSELDFFKELTLHTVYGVVKYIKGDMVRINDMFNRTEQLMMANLTKTPDYSAQNEYRLAFAIYHPRTDKYYLAQERGMLIQFDSILDYVEACD